ncbi:MAG: oligoribonuclease [Zetaproteobacteria bacterium CG_4_9_14_3_um_filter_49_83]|nr:MAG: oligoribonuclease [Zetaproteobacteria bacterium CG1_02_49_23]PIQ34578.1 MAG: oligoribonuclease [Zetaproteobacteria bacterium CG17_big_fil_post_rev_8_21_14_2_50_50_13]PIV31567.1 MAG: oligoribonuclease [Zetaproteobacteria bacterium CG02_land_8_20_14_3_00_50_9]PIY54837.1 MAG: oligoribonuclease [Zetaproteobacteria bacterium CG_4_10_14_0_8_um_filter_49_80]PJA35796.1 MAG: oligoribonuclease [Zetaproteobacteria bacterium CG_4_9_14_3_um_filter_49_83]
MDKLPDNRLVWMDLEMTGLDPDQDVILEIATIVTDNQLQIVAEGPNIVIHHDERVLSTMNPWCIEHHEKSGLSARVRKSTVSLEQAEHETLSFLQMYVQPGISPLCGNSIHQDRRFLYRWMPELESFCHYRNIDVSTVKELSARWYPQIKAPKKKEEHLALADIRESIDELKFYKKQIFIG